MASGTGLTSGPYNLAAGGLLTLADPNAKGGQVSDRVQIQNQSGFTLTVYSSGAPYTIPALQSSTIPTAAGGQSITVISSATSSTGAGSVGGSVSAVWLLPEQAFTHRANFRPCIRNDHFANSRQQFVAGLLPSDVLG